MTETVIDGVTVVPGGGAPVVDSATVVLDGDGLVRAIEPGGTPSDLTLVPSAVDLHLDNVAERRNPRASVRLDLDRVLTALDAECAAAGIGTVCIATRCEHSPGKGIELFDALEMADVVEAMAPHFACDWRLHVRIEVTDDGAIETAAEVLARSSRVALVSVMEHSVERTRFPSEEEHRRFYAKDWGLSLEEVDAILDAKRAGIAGRDDRRQAAAALARAAGATIASHDDRTPGDIEAAFALGATIAEFPLTMEAARRAQELGMCTVLGSPNAIRGRSTSPGNLLVADAVTAGVCDILCSDYLPTSLQDAPPVLAASGASTLDRAVDLISCNPAAAIGIDAPFIREGLPLNAALRREVGTTWVGVALWRSGRLVYERAGAGRSAPAISR